MSGLRGRLGRRKEGKLLQEGDEEAGVSNPTLDEDEDIVKPISASGTDSSPEMEAAEADALVKTLKTKRTKKKRELAKDLISPKDDLARELKEAKKKSRQKVDESILQEQEETLEVADDGTLPMPDEEEEGVPQEQTEEPEEESRIKKLKKKDRTEETPIEPPPDEEEETEKKDKEETEKKDEEEKKEEAPVEPEAETERKTPRMASLRSKMRDRLQKAKDEAMIEVREEAKETRRERQMKRDKKQTTRFATDEPRSKYEEMEAEELERLTEERRKQREERKKKMAAGKKESVYMPSAEEAYEFFTRNWDPEPEEEETKEKAETEVKEKKEGEEEEPKEGEEPKEPKEGEEEGEGEGEPKPGKPEDEQPLLPEFEDVGVNPTVLMAAYYPDPTEVQKKENEIYFYPSVTTIPATDKVSKEAEVRRLEEEGFYVGTRPTTSGWNLNRMEHRILKESEKRNSSKNWFGEDGKLIALPNPLRALPSRPPVSEEEEPYLQTSFKKALIREFDMRYIDGSTEGGGQYQLDVDLNQIIFSHHHLFSREHVLAQRVSQLFEQYVTRQRRNMTEYLGEKLKALKSSSLHLQDHIAAHRSEHSLTDRANYDKRLQDYKYEIRQTRALKDKEEMIDRKLLKNMIHTWKEIKAQRQLQGFTNTPVKLQVRKEEVNKDQDMFLWKQEIEDEVEEQTDEHEREYKRKMLTFEEEMTKYQKQQQAKKEAEKRINKKKGRRSSRQSGGSAASALNVDDYTEEQLQKDQQILDEPDLDKPEEPERFDANSIRETVKAKAMETRRRPGEPKLYIEMTNTASITPTPTCPTGEQKRRNDVSRCKIFVKVLFNNKEVERTAAKPLSQDFKVSYGTIYNLRIVQWPDSIKFQVYETMGLGNHMMAELCAPIPDTSVTSKSVQLEELEFSSDQRINHSHEGVGSGLPFTFGKDGQELLTLMTTGTLGFSVAWAVDEEGVALVPPSAATTTNNLFNQMKKMDPVSAIGASGVMDLQKLAEWFANSRLDPNDPSNADIVYMLRPRSGDPSLLMPSEYFRLEQLMQEFDFISEEELNQNRRFQLLQFRDEEIAEFRNFKQVPPYEREIPRDTFVEYERKKREEQRLKQMEDIESHRAAVKRFRQRIREQVMRRFRVQAHMKHWDDMVYEEAVPNVAMLGTSLLKLTERRAPLKPKRKERKKVTAQNIKGDEVKIVINITRAQNIPVRTSSSLAAFSRYYQLPKYLHRANLASTSTHQGVHMLGGRASDLGVASFLQALESRRRSVTHFLENETLQRKSSRDGGIGHERVEMRLQASRSSLQDGWSTREDAVNENYNNMESMNCSESEPGPSTWRGGTMTARGGETDRKRAEQDKSYDIIQVRPFVEIMFQHQSIRTSIADGPNPSFNEELEIPFKAPNDDYSPSNLQTLTDCIFLNLFDEVVVDIQQDDRERDSSVHQRIEKKWLGSLKIPFTTIYFNGKIDGTFRVDAPPVLLGYTQDRGFSEEIAGIDKNIKTLLSLFITIEPPLTQPEPVKERFSTNEDERLMVFADEWMNQMRSRFTPKREVKTYVTDVNFKSVFITRYFRPIKPPDELLGKSNLQASSELVARYVSLIPFISDSVIFPGLCDIWNTCDQFLQMLSGDEEEHAIMLVNFFLHMGKKAWLICGTAIPEGPTAYVLSEEDADAGYWIWNPSSGDHFRVQDMTCPLQSIGCLVNHENIWANIQQYDKPAQMSFKLTDTACWETIFGRAYPDPQLGSIQPESLYYFPTDKDYVTELQEKIQQVLKNKIMDWRSRYITRWNRHCTQIMRKVLPVLEENCGKSVDEQHIIELEQSFSSYKVSGFPINMPFTEIDPIIEAVYATGVHGQESSDVEYALAVYVHPYPNSVLSVWVYVASLNRIR